MAAPPIPEQSQIVGNVNPVPLPTPSNVGDVTQAMQNLNLGQQTTAQGDQPPADAFKIKLEDFQVPHVDRIMSILSYHNGFLDVSPTGTGKTFTTLNIVQKTGAHLIVIAPATVAEAVWSPACFEYRINTMGIISYSALAGRKGSPLSHSLLTRVGDDYEPTPYYLNLLGQGVLLVFDEAQFLRNENLTHKAARQLMKALINHPSGASRFALLSATLFDQQDLVINFLRMLGLLDDSPLSGRGKNGNTKLIGMSGLIRKCSALDYNRTKEILMRHGLSDISEGEASGRVPAAKLKVIAFELFTSVVKPALMSKMSEPPIPYPKDYKNGYYNITFEEDRTKLRNAIWKLSDATGYNPVTGDTEKSGFGELTTQMVDVEEAKLYDLARVAHQLLEEGFFKKVIICISYPENHVGILLGYLSGYKVLVLTGKTPLNKKNGIIEDFNFNKEYQILITQIKVGGVGLSLHDIVGDAPRALLISPTNSMMDMHQAAGRIRRWGLKSPVILRAFYAKTGEGLEETNILNALAKKTETSKKINEYENEDPASKAIYPGDYPKEIEPDPVLYAN